MKGKGHDDEIIRTEKDHVVRDWTCPAGCSIRKFGLREVDGDDETEAAMQADLKASDAVRESADAMATLVSRERMRLSIVDYVDLKGHTHKANDDGLPLFAFDQWNIKTVRLIERAYVKMNMLSQEDIESFDSGGQVRGAGAAADAAVSPPPRDGELLIARQSRG